ncbi:MAG: fimbria/pilus outer membrane usher protein [Serratia sp. (in: enterobacteria)]|uniref:fimbria/pilus outer membrane usher protein n=1 Tax=Serratia sp. (in: enterobacteria) TaxID=616 RepID=UPI003F33E79E
MQMIQNKLYLLVICPLLFSYKSSAITFDTSILAGASSESDLSRFYENNEMPVGKHEINIYVNGNWKGCYDVIYGKERDDIRLGWKDSQLLGINTQNIPIPSTAFGQVQLHDLVQGGHIETDPSTLSVKLTVPQAAIIRTEEGYVPPQFWDEGIPALKLSYNMTYYSTQTKISPKVNTDDFYAGLNSGVNLLGWQFRDNSTWSKRTNNEGKWENNTRYFRKPIAELKSNLIFGDFFTPGELFDSFRVRGFSITSEMKMRPNSQQGFSPVIHGVARTNALVKVIQSGNIIYQENVPPGQFSLDSIQPTGSAGDLQVVVSESDGTEQSFTVPFSSVPGMLKAGVTQYGIIAGKVNQITIDTNPSFFQGTLSYGFNNLITGYTGAIISDNYQASLFGSGWNLPFGAVSIDFTHANTKLDNDTNSGQSYRIAYSKFIDATATNFTLAAYRYSTNGYYSFNDALYSHEDYHLLNRSYKDYEDHIYNATDIPVSTTGEILTTRPKNTFTLNLNQRLTDSWGTVFFSGTRSDYWGSGQKKLEYQMGYSNSLGKSSYTISSSRVRYVQGKEETRIYASLSLPFSLFEEIGWISSSLSASDTHYEQSNISISGTAMESNRLTYSLSGSHANDGDNMATFNATYRSNYSTLGTSYSKSANFRQSGLSSRGSIVAFPWHVLTSNEVSNTMTIVEAPAASGLMINGDGSIITNNKGLALVPYATPYRKNSVTLAVTDTHSGAEIIGNMANSAPYDGAINYLHFETDKRQTWELRATRSDQTPLPFGTEVFNEDNTSVGYVGQASILYLRAENAPRLLRVRIRDSYCDIAYPVFGLNSPTAICK